jgi:putative nucleotidyltransferase with HDIG domain
MTLMSPMRLYRGRRGGNPQPRPAPTISPPEAEGARRDDAVTLEPALAVLPLSQVEQRLLLRIAGDYILRVALEPSGFVSVCGPRTSIRIAVGEGVDLHDHLDEENEADGAMKAIYREVGRYAERLLADSLETGEVQTIELHIDRNGRTTWHEVRAVACGTGRLLAVLKDVTAIRDAEKAIAMYAHELDRLNRTLQEEASLHVEKDAVLKDGYQRLRNLLGGTVEAISLIVRKKDPHTARHQERVSELACAIGREMGLSGAQVDVIGLAALLHDLGKVFTPDRILEKPGRLTDDEYAIVKDHAEDEYQVLRQIDLFAPLAEIVRQHHERLDGSGYPQGLEGDVILVEARVIAVADVMDAMLSDRPYRPARCLREALSEIVAGKGVLFDERAVEACVRVFSERRFEFSEPGSHGPQEADLSGASTMMWGQPLPPSGVNGRGYQPDWTTDLQPATGLEAGVYPEV